MTKMQRFGFWLAIAAVATPLLFVSPAQGITPEPTPPLPSPTASISSSETAAPEEPPLGVIVPFGEGYVTPDPICMEHDFVIQGPVNEVGGLGLGTPGEVGIFRVVCVTPEGEELYYKDHRHIWTEFVIEKTVEVPVQTPPYWPWSPEKIAEERAIIELNASLDGVPVVYPPYLSDEFITTGKIMTYPIGTSTAYWVLQP